MTQVAYSYCSCFLKQNIFVRELGKHFKYVNDEQFKEENQTLANLEETMQSIKSEIHRRTLLRTNVLERMQMVRCLYKPRNPFVFKFDSTIIQMPDNSREPYAQIGKEVFSLPVFKPEFTKELLEELKYFKILNIPHEQPNSMNRHGIILDEIGFQDLFDAIRVQFIQPWARKLLNEPNLILDSHKAFVVKYSVESKEVDLAAHFDNAEVTLNVALSEDEEYSGGELVFTDPPPIIGYEHRFSHGVLHRGSHVHEALPISYGERWNLIIWSRSSSLRQVRCPMCKSPPDLQPAPLGTYGDGFLAFSTE